MKKLCEDFNGNTFYRLEAEDVKDTGVFVGGDERLPAGMAWTSMGWTQDTPDDDGNTWILAVARHERFYLSGPKAEWPDPLKGQG